MALRRLLRNFFSVSAMRLITAAFSFVLFMWLARSWGAELLGEFSTLFTYFMFILQLPLLGLHIVLARDIATRTEQQGECFSNALAIALPVSLILMVIVGLIGQTIYPDNMHKAFWLVGLSSIPMAFVVAAEAVLTGRESMHVIAMVNIIETVARVGLCLILVALGFGLTALFVAFFAAKLLAVVLYWQRGHLGRDFQLGSIAWPHIFTYLRKSPMFFGILILSVGIGRFDFIFLSIFSSMREVGMYSAPFKIYEMGLMVPSVITLVLFPMFARAFSDSRPAFDQMYATMFQMTFLIGLPSVVLFAAMADFVVPFIFGAEYAESALVLQILAFAILFIAMDQVLTVVVLAGHREDLELKILSVSFVVYMALLVSLIPALGYLGAAVATLVTTCFKFFLRYFWVSKVMAMPTAIQLLFKPMLAGIGMVAALLLTHYWLGLIPALLVGLVMYVSCSLLLKVLSREQVLGFRALLARPRSP
ncbi:flippase [Methylophaga lonarensis]|uniref:flippase n=1 Tax=Methylophaga lonarensis TaxID=999151 RepID=UPI003D2D888F